MHKKKKQRRRRADAEERMKRAQEEKATKEKAEAEALAKPASPWQSAPIDLDPSEFGECKTAATQLYECDMGLLKRTNDSQSSRPEIDAENEARAKDIQECEMKFREAQAAFLAAKERKAALEARRDLLEAKTLRLGASTITTESIASTTTRLNMYTLVYTLGVGVCLLRCCDLLEAGGSHATTGCDPRVSNGGV